MNKKPILLFGLFVTLLFIMACSFAGTDSEPSQEAGTTPIENNSQAEAVPSPTVAAENTVESSEPITSTGGMPVTGAGLCANAYYPVREGSTWNYTDSGSAGSVDYTDTITSIRNDGFTLTTQFDNLTRTQEWSCTPEGLVALQLGGGLTTQSSGLVIETQSASGVTLPVEIHAGDMWNHSIEFTGTMDMAGTPAEAVGTATSDFTAIGTESVTTPAGTFDAMKLQVETVLDYKVTFQGMEVPVIFNSSTTSWYVEGVGWVKSDGSGSFQGVTFSDQVILQWYNIP